MCLNRVGGLVHIAAHRTTIACIEENPLQQVENPTTRPNEQNYQITPCPNHFFIKERYSDSKLEPEDTIYKTTGDDNEIEMSVEDRYFLDIMEKGVHKNHHGNWEMPRSEVICMPNNRSQALTRLNGLLRNFKRKPQLEKDYREFLGRIIERGHAVPIPASELYTRSPQPGQVWYLPHFGVYHPRKPGQIRVVFDSSAEFRGTSLNQVLLPGPDLSNSLVGVLFRFRHHEVGLMANVEQMFHSFHVDPKHRDFLRFLWFEDNDPAKRIMEYCMTVHLFGNAPSPAIATFGLKRTADDGEERLGKATRDFIHRNFYVDDGLTSRPTPEGAIGLIKSTQAALATANKVVSNNPKVTEALPVDDRAKDVHDLDLRNDVLPVQRSLGVYWDLSTDSFTFKVSMTETPFTRRGVLSVVNSVYNPLGFAAPVVLRGKLLLQKLVVMGNKNNRDRLNWDDPLPDELMRRWQSWRDSLIDLEQVAVSRCYRPEGFGPVVRNEIHAFSDASQDAIGAVVYLRQLNDRDEVNVSFVLGQSKVAPTKQTSIPRLELCGAVLSTLAVKRVLKEIDLEIHEVTFYTDSMVVLGYIQNEARRFYVYVANRVQTIRSISKPDQWRYIDSAANPADLATRDVPAASLKSSRWLMGPSFLKEIQIVDSQRQDHITLDECDPEVRTQVIACATAVTTPEGLGSARASRLSSWWSLI